VRSLVLWNVNAHDDFLYSFALELPREQPPPAVDLYLPREAAAELAQALDAAAAEHAGDGGDALLMQAGFTNVSEDERARARAAGSAIAWRALPAPLRVTVLSPAAGERTVRADFVLANGDVVVELSLAPAAAREWARRLRHPRER
jgi:hypothetical protein